MKVVNKVNLSKNKFSLKDFSAFCEKVEDVTVSENGVSEGYGFYDTGLYFSGEQPQAIYCSNGKIYSYNGTVNEITENGDIELGDCVGLPATTEIIYYGKRYSLFLSSGLNGFGVSPNGSVIPVELPDTEFCVVVGGRLFGAYNQSVYFTKPFDFERSTTKLSVDGSVSFSNASGKIVGLSVKDRKLYIFCKHAIYKLNAFGESIDFKLEKLSVGNINIVESSVSDVYERTVFMSAGKIYAFNKDKIKPIFTLSKIVNIVKSGRSASMQSAYILPFTIDGGKDKYFIYDFENDSYSFMDCSGGAICNGGYFCAQDNTVKRIDRFGQKGKNGVYKSIAVDMGNFNDKSLLKVSLFVSSDCKLKISGDSGSRTFSLKKGCNKKRLNLLSKRFSFEISEIGQGFSLSNLDLEYTVRGE